MAKNILRESFIYYIFTVILAAIQFFIYLADNSLSSHMDTLGYSYYITADISHSAIFALPPFLLAIIAGCASRKPIVADVTHILLASMVNLFIYINGFVFAFYRFHINGMMLELCFGDGGDQVVKFDTMLYIKMSLVIVAILVLNILLRHLAKKMADRQRKVYFWPATSAILACSLYANIVHAYSAAVTHQTVTKSATFLPYNYPLTATSLMKKLGVVSQDDIINADFGSQSGFKYPRREISADTMAHRPNIVLIAIDSWNHRSMTDSVMPNVTAFMKDNTYYSDHLSTSNGTRGGIFGMFFGISSYYWKDFESSGTTPVLIDVLDEREYSVKTFPSATLTSPNFQKLIFRNVNINADTKGKRVYDRDCQLTTDFLDFLDSDEAKKPFFSFMFYDLAHSFEFPAELKKKFTPSWDFADYMKLSNDMDPTPFWNLYLNTINAVDSLIGIVIRNLEEREMMDSTYIIITGDHGQEFNENHKNIWGHGGDFSYAQIHVPLIIHNPGQQHQVYNHRTTHFDISTTLLHDILRVNNDISDYSMGRLLTDTTFRNWHIVGNNDNFAFILKDNSIVEKHFDGTLDVTDHKLDPIPDYKLNAMELNNAIMKLNMFYED